MVNWASFATAAATHLAAAQQQLDGQADYQTSCARLVEDGARSVREAAEG